MNNHKKPHLITLIGIVMTLSSCNQTETPPIIKADPPKSPEKTQVLKPVNLDNLGAVPSQLQGKTIYHIQTNNQQKAIALTFDDGPWNKTTEQVLQILKQNQVKATFFWLGDNLQKYPQIGKKVVADGHAIGNHTWHHWYRKMDEKTAASEIDKTSALIYKTTGVKTLLFRPPGGFLNNGIATYAKKQKYVVVMWSVSSADTDKRAEPIAFVNNVLKGAKSGAIVLMHDGGGDHSKTVKALPQIIAGLKKQGYQFVTVPELLNIQNSP